MLGSILGVLPGGGAALASFSAYTLEKKVSRHPERFGKGAVQGVAGPEAANNAAAQTSFIPMLTLGIPSNGTMALMMGAMMIHNIQPGPQVITQQPVLFWGLITSMFVGNVMLVLLNLPLVGMWVKLISVPYRFLYPAILMFCVIGLFSIQNQTFEIMTAAVFGLVGYLFIQMKCEPAPLLLGFILGPMLESNLKRAMLLAKGDATTFFTRPVSATMLFIALLLVLTVVLPQFRKKRRRFSPKWSNPPVFETYLASTYGRCRRFLRPSGTRAMPVHETLLSSLKDRTLVAEAAKVGGEWVSELSDGSRFDVLNPATGVVLASLPALSTGDARRAVDVAKREQKAWAKRTGKDRAAILKRWHQLWIESLDDLALILTSEQGKPIGEARAEVLYGAAYLEWFAEEAKRIYGDIIPAHAENLRI